MCGHVRAFHHGGGQCCYGHAPRIEGFIVPCLLLLLKDQPAHGYELMEKLNKLTFLETVPDPGVVYRHLRRLEEEGMVESRLEQSSAGPARKVYSLTAEGESYLQAWAASIRQRKESLDAFLAEYTRRFPNTGNH